MDNCVDLDTAMMEFRKHLEEARKGLEELREMQKNFDPHLDFVVEGGNEA